MNAVTTLDIIRATLRDLENVKQAIEYCERVAGCGGYSAAAYAEAAHRLRASCQSCGGYWTHAVECAEHPTINSNREVA